MSKQTIAARTDGDAVVEIMRLMSNGPSDFARVTVRCVGLPDSLNAVVRVQDLLEAVQAVAGVSV